jgi:PAS domain S-box-containing protein
MSLTRALAALGADPDRLFDELDVPMYLIGVDGTIRWHNRALAELTGDMRGTHLARVIVHEHWDRAEQRFAAQTQLDGPPIGFSIVVRGSNGRRKRLRVRSQAINDAGRFAGVFGVVDSAHDDAWPAQGPTLTARQHQVLKLLAAGRSTPEIAAELGVTVETARNHIRRLLHNLATHSRIEAVARGRELGLL